MGKYVVVLDEKDEPTQEDTASHIFGAIPHTYDWWRGITEHWDTQDAPDGWTATIRVTDPEDENEERTIVKTITHTDLMDAMRKIISGEIGEDVTDSCKGACRDFVFNRDAADFDAATSDEVLQVAVLGKVVYC
jgi:hypothetical protein